MKLPEKIKGRHRIRDGGIVLFFKRDALTVRELSEKFKLTERRIQQVLAKNHAFVKRDKEWEREKRISILNRLIKNKYEQTSKDLVDLLSELKKEIEGEKSLIDNSKHTSITYIWPSRNDTVHPSGLSEGSTRGQESIQGP